MTTLVMMRGLPGSGKTTAAKSLTGPSTIRVSRDDMRAMFTGTDKKQVLDQHAEESITKSLSVAVRSALTAGVNVIVDNTNLLDRDRDHWRLVAERSGAEFQILDLTDVPYAVCVERNAARGENAVPARVMKRMARNAGVLLGELRAAEEALADYAYQKD